jgi:hypothetical protein
VRTLDEIQRQLADGDFEFSRHALRRVVERNIGTAEIQEAGAHFELIEDYPDDKYSPSMLLLGFTDAGRPLHLHVTLSMTGKTKIITLYEPDPREWDDFRRRR